MMNANVEKQPMPDGYPLWDTFRDINRQRRAIRDFDGRLISEADARAVLAEASLAPSSGNLQPYQMHWIKDPKLKARVAQACNGQRGPAAAATLVVFTASPRIALGTVEQQLTVIEASKDLSAQSKIYHRAQARRARRLVRFGSPAFWTPFLFLAALVRPSLSLLPIGSLGSRGWAARNALLAAQTLMLACAARGIDTCPMEGFSAPRIVRLLGLSRGTVVPIVISLGYRASGARIETQWRRAMSEVVVEH